MSESLEFVNVTLHDERDFAYAIKNLEIEMLSWITRRPQLYQKALYRREAEKWKSEEKMGGWKQRVRVWDLKSKAAGFEEGRRGLEPRNVGSHQKLEEVRKQVLSWSPWSEPEPANALISA